MTVSRTRSETRKGRGWVPFGAAVFAIVALLLGSNLPNPLFPLYAQRFGLSPLEITLIFATYTLLVIPALILLAPLSDARGRRLLFGGAIIVAAVAAALFAAATSAAWLFVAQAVQAFSLGGLQGSAAPLLVETDPSRNIRRAAGIASAATLGGAAVGPLLASSLAEYGPFSPRLPYVVEIGLLLAALATVRLLPGPRETQAWHPRRPQIPTEIRGHFALASVSAFVGWAVTGLYLALIPSFVTTTLHHDLVVAGAVMALLLGASAVTAAFAHRFRSVPTQVAGLATMAASVGILFAAAQRTSLAALLVGSLVAGVGQGLAFMGSLADVNEMAPDDRKANVVASYYVVVYLGTAVPVVGVGALAGSTGLLEAIEIFAVVVFVVSLLGVGALLQQGRRTRFETARRRFTPDRTER